MGSANTGESRGETAERLLAASHERLRRECARASASKDTASISLGNADGALTYVFDGVVHPVTWFDLLTFGEGLKKEGIIDDFDAYFPTISFELDDRSRARIGGFFLAVDGDDRPQAESRSTVSPISSAPAKVVVPEVRRRRPAGSLPEIRDIIEAILGALLHSPLKRSDLIDAAGKSLGYPLTKAHAGEVPTDGISVSRTMDRIFALLDSSDILRRRRKTFALTDEGRLRIAAGIDVVPECAPVMENDPPTNPSRPKKPTPTGLGRHTHGELVNMWMNAVKVMADPLKKKDHGRAKEIVDRVTREWEARAKLADGYFKWPSTEAKGGTGRLAAFEAEKEGMLSFLEYRVGRTKGESARVRQIILRRVFEGALPPVFGKEYMAQWGANGSPERLHKMASSIAAFARNFKRRKNGAFEDAIRDWEADLSFLRANFYVGRFRFGWPATDV